jgi:hypothetical protein
MERIVYKEFDLKIEADNYNNRYEVSASSSCGGDARETFTLDELKDFDFASSSNDQTETTERHFSISNPISNNLSLIKTRAPSSKKARDFGRQLFKVVFKDKVGMALDRCLRMSREDNTQLRIRLNLTRAPLLAVLPWEFLCEYNTHNFLVKSYNSIVRYLELAIPYSESLLTNPPLRILVVLSNPEGAPKLDVEGELRKLQDAINRLEVGHQIVLDPLYKPTSKALNKRLHEHRTSDPYHVFHFIGHGVFDSSSNEGKLLLESATGGVSAFSAEELGEILATHHSIRLAVINACEGARTSQNNSYSGFAQSLLRSGAAPVVIAMQYVISDDAAKIFAQHFYEALLLGHDVDSAVTSARMSISEAEKDEDERRDDDDSVEWGTPVIYMRATDSRLVDFHATAGESAATSVHRPTSRKDNQLERHYQDVLNHLSEGQVVPFLGLNVNLFDQQATPRPPAYSELVELLTKSSKYPHNLGAPLAGVSQYAQLSNKLATLYDELAPLFNDSKYQPTPLHNFWARVAARPLKAIDSKRRRFVVVTTSYDELLERAFSQTVEQFYVFSYIAEGNDHERGKFFRKLYQNAVAHEPILVEWNNKELTDELPVILKLPGTIGMFNSKIRFAITEDQYFDLLTIRELTNILPSQLMIKLRGSHHLFLGYNISDWNMRGMLYRIWDKHETPYQSWAVQEALPEFERRYWEACNVDIIDENLARYVAELDKRLT